MYHRGVVLPLLLLAVYALAFAGRALSGGLLVFDDHPGQLYRLAQAIEQSPWPWFLNPGWWTGYAELQYYPPGFAYAGAAIYRAALGSLDVATVYQSLLWVTFLLPAFTTYALLARVLGSPWLALPGAFLALTLSAGSRSGVEEGLRWGLVAARLGWSLLPLLALRLVCSNARAPLGAAALLAGIAITHPAHAPAAAMLVLLACSAAPGAGRMRARRAALLLAGGVGLSSFWLIPLFCHLDMALPLDWGPTTLVALGRGVLTQPLLLGLLGASAIAWWRTGPTGGTGDDHRWLARWAPAMAGVILLDTLVAEPAGIAWLPADRLMDSFLLALIIGASLSLGALHRRVPALPVPGLAILAIACGALLSMPGRPEPTLSLWPRAGIHEWPKYEATARDLRLGELWEALRQAPTGRILFIRSGVPLEPGADWRRPHTHITALAPRETGREIVNGTFTHPSPIAGLLYTGSPANRPITLLVERRDGITLFGRPLGDLSPRTFVELADPLRVSAVVALDEDEGRIGFVRDASAFSGPARIGPFLIYTARQPQLLPARVGAQRWRLPPSAQGEWISTGMADSPLWRTRAGAATVEVRRGPLGLLEVRVPVGLAGAIEIEHVPGVAEWAGSAVSAGSALLLLAVWRGRSRAPRPSPSPRRGGRS